MTEETLLTSPDALHPAPYSTGLVHINDALLPIEEAEIPLNERETQTMAVLPPSGVSEQLDWFDPIAGEQVNFVLGPNEIRPAHIVRVFSSGAKEGMVNLVVFTDGENDKDLVPERLAQRVPLTLWRTSVHNDQTEKAVGTWHY